MQGWLVGKGGEGVKWRVLCVLCATRCALLREKHIVNGVEHVKQQTGPNRAGLGRELFAVTFYVAGFKLD